MENLEKIEKKHFEFALSKIKSTLPKSVIEKYENMAKMITESRNIKESKDDLYR
jgi:hypothetical protein